MASSTPITTTTSRKGGVPHTLTEWYTSPFSSSPGTSNGSGSGSNTSNTDSTLPSPDRITHRSLSISTWTITSSRGAIGNSSYMDQLSDRLKIPPPEMVFPSNQLTLHHLPSGFQYTFEAEKALRCVDGVSSACKMSGMDLSQEWRGGASSAGSSGNGDAGATSTGKTGTAVATHFGEKPRKKAKGIKVAYADEWGKSREPSSVSPAITSAASSSTAAPTTAFGSAAATQIADARDYDWTFSTTWAGQVGQDPSSSSASSTSTTSSTLSSATPLTASEPSRLPAFQPGTDPSVDRIPVERLGPSSGEPILFYDDLVLFEDELGDNGTSMLGVKVRVMPSGFLVLQRFLLRVDDVVFRLFDTRMYCAFDEKPSETSKVEQAASRGAPPATAPWASSPARVTTSSSQQSEQTNATSRLPSLGGLSLGAPRRNGSSPTTSTPQQLSRAGGTSAPTMGRDTEPWSSSTSSQRLIRECSGCEAPYRDVKARLPAYRSNDLSMLTDPNWVSQTLQTLAAKQFAAYQSTNLTSPDQTQQLQRGPAASSDYKTSSTTSSHGTFSSSYSSSSIQPPSRGGLPPSSSPLTSQNQGGRTHQPPNTLLAHTLAPARLSSIVGSDDDDGSATGSTTVCGGIVGEMDSADVWEGVGGRVDVVTFP